MDEINLFGIAFDKKSSSMRGAAFAPEKIRKVLRSGVSNMFTEAGMNLEEIPVNDMGDIYPDRFEGIAGEVEKICKGKTRLLTLGGDHSITFPVVQVLARQYEEISILHIDAHADLYDSYDGDKFSHASPFARIMENKLAGRLVQVGIRTLNDHQREQSQKFGTEIIKPGNFSLKKLPLLNGNIYLSIDLDGIDPAFAPGVSHQEPGGLTPRDVIDVIQNVKGKLIGADIVEYNPLNDSNGITASLAAKLTKELLGRMCSG